MNHAMVFFLRRKGNWEEGLQVMYELSVKERTCRNVARKERLNVQQCEVDSVGCAAQTQGAEGKGRTPFGGRSVRHARAYVEHGARVLVG